MALPTLIIGPDPVDLRSKLMQRHTKKWQLADLSSDGTLDLVIIGILSDTHGRADMAKAAVQLLLGHKAEYFVHCGDVGSSEVLTHFAGYPSMFVFGNNDYDYAELTDIAKLHGILCGNMHGKLTFGEKRASVTHGHDHQLVHRLIREQEIDYLFLGHTHETMNQRQGKIRVINPGALYRATQKTVALLDTGTDTVTFLPVNA